MRVFVRSLLPCDPQDAWAEVKRSSLLLEVARPFVIIRPAKGESFPEQWRVGETICCRSYMFGVVPLGTRMVSFDTIDNQAREIHTREADPLVRSWNHVIRVEVADGGSTRYSDDVEIDAGWLTPVVWLFAQCFYRHRQRRWKTVANRLSRV